MTKLFLVHCKRVMTGLVFCAVLSASARAADSFVVQWKAASPERPWLSKLEVVSYSENITLTTKKLPSSEEYPNGLRVRLTKQGVGADYTGFAAVTGDPAWIQVRLDGGYGFLVSNRMLDDHAYLWVRDLGIYISRAGGWTETAKQRAEAAQQIATSSKKPFVSCAEKYFQWTGQVEHEPGLDRQIWDFVKEKQTWPLEARTIGRIAEMSEVDASYFTSRFPDLKYSRMYLGWPDHNDEFILWNNGKIGVSSESVGGDPKSFPDIPWQPRASGYTLQFGVGDAPRFREYGDDRVRQSLRDGFHLIATTEWSEPGLEVKQTSFAYPLDGETIKRGVEPLLAWVNLHVSNSTPSPHGTYLGIEFTNQDFGGSIPLSNLRDLTWRKNGFYLLGKLVAVTDPALEFEEIPTTGDRKRFRALVHLEASEGRDFVFADFYRPVSPARLEDVRRLGYQTAMERTLAFWNRMESQGASISVPDPLLNNLYKTFLPRITINSDLDLNSFSVLQTGPIVYNRVWHHNTAYSVADYLSRRGYFDLAKRYLEPFFHWQGIPAPDSPAIKDWSGFFGAPPEQCPLVWLMYQGMIQWASARYYQLSNDRAWLDERLPSLLNSMEWVRETRSENKKSNPDGSHPLNYGWFPPGRVTDGSHGTSVFSDANIWRGMEFMTQVLESIHHPRAAEFRAETDDYRLCIQDGMRRAAAERPLVRLNDDTWVPYLPAYLEKVPGQMESTRWYAAVVDAAWMGGLLDTRVFPLGSPEDDWVANFFEDSYSPMNPSLPDEPQWATSATYYLHNDQVKNFLYTFYSQSTTTMARQTLTTYEHRSWGKRRVFELTPWAAGYWTRNFTDMLCRTVGNELWLMQATPRRWLADGKKTEVRNLQTEFGPISYSVRSKLASGTVEAEISPPRRNPASKLKVRFRVPENRNMKSVTVNGQKWTDFDPAGEWVTIPGSLQDATVTVQY
jgi:hypothetical protein